MSGFSDAWLALREPADHDARDQGLTDRLRLWLASRTGADALGARRLAITDLGAGTGSNLRYLAPRLGPGQHWRLVDNDAQLLQGLAARMHVWAREEGFELRSTDHRLHLRGGTGQDSFSACIDTVEFDLASDLSSLALDDSQLLTCSALLDLCSDAWIDELVAQIVAVSGCAALFVLSYDGQVAWKPPLPADAHVLDLLNRHQRIDKGLGAALGPAAGEYAQRAFTEADYEVQSAASDWVIRPAQTALQQTLAEGWMEAAAELDPPASDALKHWYRERCRCMQSGRSHLRVGHRDFLATPRGA